MTQNNTPICTGDREVAILFDNTTETACLYLGRNTSAWLTVDGDGDVYPDSEIPQDTAPAAEWFRETLRIELPPAVSAAALHHWLSKGETQDLLESLHLGHQLKYDAACGRLVGTLTDDAENALATLKFQTLDLYTLEVWDADEWIYESTFQNLWESDMTLKEAVAALRSEAKERCVHIHGSIAKALLDRAVEAANDGHVLTQEQHASLVEAGREDELLNESQEDAEE